MEEKKGFREGVKWIHEERDVQSALRMWRQGKLGLGEWLASYRGRKTYALAAWNDPGPIAVALFRLIRRLFSGLKVFRLLRQFFSGSQKSSAF